MLLPSSPSYPQSFDGTGEGKNMTSARSGAPEFPESIIDATLQPRAHLDGSEQVHRSVWRAKACDEGAGVLDTEERPNLALNRGHDVVIASGRFAVVAPRQLTDDNARSPGRNGVLDLRVLINEVVGSSEVVEHVPVRWRQRGAVIRECGEADRELVGGRRDQDGHCLFVQRAVGSPQPARRDSRARLGHQPLTLLHPQTVERDGPWALHSRVTARALHAFSFLPDPLRAVDRGHLGAPPSLDRGSSIAGHHAAVASGAGSRASAVNGRLWP